LWKIHKTAFENFLQFSLNPIEIAEKT